MLRSSSGRGTEIGPPLNIGEDEKVFVLAFWIFFVEKIKVFEKNNQNTNI